MSQKEFLFGRNPGHSVFDTATYERRKEISKEQMRFVLAVVRYNPSGVLRSAIRNFAEQLTDCGLSDFSYPGDKMIKDLFPEAALHQSVASRAYRGTINAKGFTGAVYVSAISCVIFLAVVCSGDWGWNNTRNRCGGVVLWVFIGIVMNAAVCGCFSGFDSRYQARVIWLLPLISQLSVCDHGSRLNPSRPV
jgi:hypothetical protein